MRPRLKILHNQLPWLISGSVILATLVNIKSLNNLMSYPKKKPITVFFPRRLPNSPFSGHSMQNFQTFARIVKFLSCCFVFTNSMHGEKAAERALYSRQDIRQFQQWVTKVTSVHVQWCSPGHQQLNNISIYMCMRMYQRISNGLNPTLVSSLVGPLRLTQMEVVCLLFLHHKLSLQNSVQALEIMIVFLSSFLIQSYYDTGLNRLSFACSSVFL